MTGLKVVLLELPSPLPPAGLPSWWPVMAIFRSSRAQQLWGVMFFCWRRYGATEINRKAFQHQQDLSLRNNESPLQTLWHFMQIAWAWRSRTDRRTSWNLAVLLILLPSVLTAVAIIAAILSSQIVNSKDDNVLVGNRFVDSGSRLFRTRDARRA